MAKYDHAYVLMWCIREAAKVVRQSMTDCNKWRFSGDFQYDSPIELKLLLKWILFGEVKSQLTDFKTEEINRTIDILCQQISVNSKGRRSVSTSSESNFEKKETEQQRRFYQNETAVSVGLGLSIYGKTRSKKIIKDLADLNIVCKYKKIKEIEDCMYDYVCRRNVDTDGVYIPDNISKSTRPFFAIDNADFKRDSKDGKGELHATLITVFQNKTYPENRVIQLSRVQDTTLPPNKQRTVNEACYPPKQSADSTPLVNFRNVVYTDEKTYTQYDECWALTQMFDVDRHIPTWKAYNARLCGKTDKTTIAMLPLIKSPPTDLGTLYSALKICQGISTTITPNKKTIVTLDLQLYIKAVQLATRNDIGNHFIFRMGELHVDVKGNRKVH